MKKILQTGSLFIVIAAMLWAFDGVIRRSLYTLPPLTIVFYEHLIGLLILAPFAIKAFLKERFTKKEWIAIVWVSFFSGLMGTLWFTTALLQVFFIPFSVVFLLQKLQPVFAVGTAHVLLKEKVTPRYILWAFLAIGFAYFVTFPNGLINFDTGKGTITAALYAVAAAFAWGSSTAVSRYALLKHSQTAVTGLRFFLTTIMTFLAMVLFVHNSLFLIHDSSQILRFVAIALSTGMVALWLYYRGLKTTETKVATILELVFPATAVVIDLIFYHTVLTLSQYVAAVFLLYCVFKISRLNKK